MIKENQKTCPELAERYIISVDGGGTKTRAALTDFKGRVLKMAKTGSSNLRNVGIKKAIFNISKAILKVINGVKKKDVLLICIALAAVEEEFKFRKEEIKREILKNQKISKVFQGEIKIVSDQLTAFKSGTDEKEGIVLISGTGCVARGWRKGKDEKVSGWGYLNDEGSGFWVGQKGYQAIFKDLDNRGPKTKITKLVFQNWKIKNKEELMKKVYSRDFVRQVSLISKIVDTAAEKGDRIAKLILKEAGEELGKTTNTVIKKLNFQKQKFPLVLVGKIFNSKIVLETVKKEIKKVAPKAEFILPKVEPVIGAVKLAIEQTKTK